MFIATEFSFSRSLVEQETTFSCQELVISYIEYVRFPKNKIVFFFWNLEFDELFWFLGLEPLQTEQIGRSPRPMSERREVASSTRQPSRSL